MLNGRVFEPGVVPVGIVAAYVKTLFPGITSPLEPSSKNCWVLEPPMVERSAVTNNPVLAGFVPGVTVTVSVDESPGSTELGVAAPMPDGLVEARTVREIEVLPVRFRGLVSVMVAGRVFTPPLVPFATVALNEKTLSFGVKSPFEPSSKKDWLGEPPMEERLTLTVCAVLGGFVPGVTVTVKSVELPGATELGLAAPTPVGFVGPPPPIPRMETLSIANA